MPLKRSLTTASESANRDGPIQVAIDQFPGRPVFDTAVTHALLRRVSEGAIPETIRLYVPDDIVLFSLLDARRPGFALARDKAQQCGFDSVLRLAGGHAALFHPRCLAFSWAMPDFGEPDGIRKRFEKVAGWIQKGLVRMGVDARIGEVSGEYCPGEFSINCAGRVKLMGIGQRVIRGAAHVGGVIVVGDSPRVRDVLEPIYEALELDWNPATAGSIEEAVPGAQPDEVRSRLLQVLETERAWTSAVIDADTLSRAEALSEWHDPHGSPRATALASVGSKSLTLQD